MSEDLKRIQERHPEIYNFHMKTLNWVSSNVKVEKIIVSKEILGELRQMVKIVLITDEMTDNLDKDFLSLPFINTVNWIMPNQITTREIRSGRVRVYVKESPDSETGYIISSILHG